MSLTLAILSLGLNKIYAPDLATPKDKDGLFWTGVETEV